MAELGLESLAEVDRLHEEAAAQFDTLHGQLFKAQGTEYEAARTRLSTYETVLRGGFIIEQVIDTEGVKYFAGIDDKWGRFWPKLDEQHAQKLVGAFAVNAEPHIDRLRAVTQKLERRTQETDFVTFEILGRHDNEKPDEENGGDLDVGTRLLDGTTEYSALLSAIKFRLPTPEEVLTLGESAHQQGLTTTLSTGGRLVLRGTGARSSGLSQLHYLPEEVR
ncbi:MAG TPA: hypothetical protein VIH90_04315 [Candidatus Saccharimonadales bacterium]